MFEKFNSQKTDDVFVEAATNISARQAYIDKLVKSRVQLTRLLTFTGIVFLLDLAFELFTPLSSASSSFSQSLSILQLILLGLLTAVLLIGLTSTDLAIKFLKALEAGERPMS